MKKEKAFVYVKNSENEFKLTTELNKFNNEFHDVFATQIKEPNGKINHWVAFVWYYQIKNK